MRVHTVMQALPQLAGAQGAAGPLAAAVPGARIPRLWLGAVGHAAGDSSSRQVGVALAGYLWRAMQMTACLGSSHAPLRTTVPQCHEQLLSRPAVQYTSVVWLLTVHLESCSSGRASCGGSPLQPAQQWCWCLQRCSSSGAQSGEATECLFVGMAAIGVDPRCMCAKA